MSTIKDVLQVVKQDFIVENERIKAQIVKLEASLEWEEAPSGRNKREFRMLHSKEAKLKTIEALRSELKNQALEMEEFQCKLQHIMKDPEGMLIKLQREILIFKKRLPVYRFRSKVLHSIQNFDVTVLVADTGSGKSTLIPQFIFGMDESLVTYCAQPRRLAANSLADFTKDCLGLDDKDDTVATDFSSWDTTFKKNKSRIVYTTNFGMLHKWRKDKTLSEVDIVVIDEAHERNLATDLLLGIMKEVFLTGKMRKKPLKLVIMSATIDPALFCDFFRDESIQVNFLTIPGKTYPVEIIYDNIPLSDNPRTYLARTITKIKNILTENESGDILAFLATPAEIDEGVDILEEHFKTLGRNLKAFPLHGNVEPSAQKALFKKNPSVEQQRVIIATKIAETSVTLPDIMFVVDSGRQKEFTYDLVKNIGELSLSQISKTSAIQRAGRAGRVGPGVCFRLYQQNNYEDFLPSQSPEIQCLPLDQSLLSLFYLGFSSPSSFQFIDPPNPEAIKVGIDSLLSLNAIKKIDSSYGEEYELSTLGSKMAKFNIDPRLAHLIVSTIETERNWIPEVLVICGMVSSGGNVFYRYGDYESADFQKLKFCHPSGDFVTMLEAFKRWTYVPVHEQKSWTKRNYISSKAMFSVRKFYNRSISQINKIFRHENLPDLRNHVFPIVQSYDPLLKLIYESFKRSTAVFAGHFKTGYVSPVTSQRMVLHPSSSFNKLDCEYPPFICYDKVMTTTRTSIFHASLVKPEWIQDKESLYTDFVKSSIVEHVNDYPRLGNKLLRCKIMRSVKELSPKLDERICKNAEEEKVTNFYKIYLNWELGVISTYCHSENKSILVNHVNDILKEAVDSSKSERCILPIYGTPNSLNVGLNGIVNEIIIPGSFLSIRIAMYDLTFEEVEFSIEQMKENLTCEFKIKKSNPYEAELMFNSKEDARSSYNILTKKFPYTNPRMNENNASNETISIRFFLKLTENINNEDGLRTFVTKLIGINLSQIVSMSLINKDQNRKRGKPQKNLDDKSEAMLEVHSFIIANQIFEKIDDQRFSSWNTSTRCTWKTPNKVSELFMTTIRKKLPNCKFEESSDGKTKVTLLDKSRIFPLTDDFVSKFTEVSTMLEGTSMSRPFVPLFFDLSSHGQKLREIEMKCGVAMVQDQYAQEFSLKIYGSVEDTNSAIKEIDSYLENMKTTVSEISFGKENGKTGLLLQLLKKYGTNLHKLFHKRGIGSVEMIFSKGILRISGNKDALSLVENEIAEIEAKCSDLGPFEDEENTCAICFLTPDKNDSYRLDLCGHLICLHQCLKMMMISSEFPLSCPREACSGGGITVQDMHTAFRIGPDVKKAFMNNCLKYFLASNKNIKNCPVVNCNGIYKVLESNDLELDSRVTCDVCHKDICIRCMVEYHKDLSCEMFKAGVKNDLSTLLMRKVLKICPKCKSPIEKNGGCLHITCQCGAHFCWYCLQIYPTSSGVYSHLCPVTDRS